MPRLDAHLDVRGKAQFQSIIDLTKGYWQIPLAPEAKEKTAFATSSEVYHFLKMPFRMQGAAASFQ